MSQWIKTVTTDTVNTPPGVMKLRSQEMVDLLFRKNMHLPRMHKSIIQYLQYFLNRGGRRLDVKIRRETERAKAIVQANYRWLKEYEKTYKQLHE